MKNHHDLAKGWFRKAESDLATARLVLSSAGPYDTACYHAQQAVEKYLKGFLALQCHPIPRIHDLLELGQLCATVIESWPVDPDELAELMPYAVESRYDLDFFPDQAAASSAVSLAQKICEAVLSIV